MRLAGLDPTLVQKHGTPGTPRNFVNSRTSPRRKGVWGYHGVEDRRPVMLLVKRSFGSKHTRNRYFHIIVGEWGGG